MGLRKASTNVKTIDLGDGSFIGVVEDISKRDFNNLIAAMPQDIDQEKGLTPVQGINFQSALFEIFVKSWSFETEPSVEEYLSLSRDSADQVDEALIAHFNGLTPDAPKERKPRTSRS